MSPAMPASAPMPASALTPASAPTPHPNPVSIRALLRDAQVSPTRLAASIAFGTLALGSAVGLSAVAAWLIATAAQMPSPSQVAVAAVAVRFFGIGRGVFRYLDRLASHETALRGVVALRTRTYERVARQGAERVLAFRRGDVVARIGADIDAMGDAVVRALIPLGVAATVSLAAIVITVCLHVWAGVALALCLAAGAALSGLGTWRSTRAAAEAAVNAGARVSTATLEAIDGAIEHRVWGTSTAAAEELAAADRDAEAAAEVAARPAAWAAAALQGAQATALVVTLTLAVLAVRDHGLPPASAAVIALLPLAAFEAVGAVPGATMQAFRSAAATRRVMEMTSGAATSSAPSPALSPALSPAPVLHLNQVRAAWPGMTPTIPVTATVEPAGALAIVGRSGIGKTTLLLTMAGALPPAYGQVTLDGAPVDEHTLGHTIAITPEDAHVFGTTVLENLRVARGDVSEEEATAALRAVGLGAWLDSRPDGISTVLGPGGLTVSGGERRRLLLARALLSPAPIHLIDEPAEHLDAEGIDALRALVAAMRERGTTVVIVTHDLGILDVVQEVISLDAATSTR